jgi:hypothetical protein
MIPLTATAAGDQSFESPSITAGDSVKNYTVVIEDSFGNRWPEVDENKAPVIISISPGSGKVGTPVTITGTGFGTTKGTVTFNGTTATVTSWQETSINTMVPAGATTGNVVATVNAAASNGVPFTVNENVTCAFFERDLQVSLPNVQFKSCQKGGTINNYSNTITGILMNLNLNANGSLKNSAGDITGTWTCNSLNLNLNTLYNDGIDKGCWGSVPAQYKYVGTASVTVSNGVSISSGSGNVTSQLLTFTRDNCPTIGNATYSCTTSTPFTIK